MFDGTAGFMHGPMRASIEQGTSPHLMHFWGNESMDHHSATSKMLVVGRQKAAMQREVESLSFSWRGSEGRWFAKVRDPPRRHGQLGLHGLALLFALPFRKAPGAEASGASQSRRVGAS